MKRKVLAPHELIARYAIGMGRVLMFGWLYTSSHRSSPTISIVDDSDWDAQTKCAHYTRIAAENKIEHSIWGIDQVTDFHQVPFPKATKLVNIPRQNRQ